MTQLVKIYVPIAKTEQMPDGRLKVTCTMTSEALDHQNEVVDFDGAENAAITWKGNIRLGHGGPPVGKRIQLMPNRKGRNMGLEFFISKTEQDVQEKVREKILDGVSVGGNVKPGGRVVAEVDDELIKRYPKIPVSKRGEQITILKEWEQVELALVDAAANPESQGLSIVKQLDGQLVATDLLGTEEEGEDDFGLEDSPERRGALVACINGAIEALKPALVMEVDTIGDEDHHALETLIHIVDDLRQVAEREKHAVALAAATEGRKMTEEKRNEATDVTKEQAEPKGTDATAEGEGTGDFGLFVTTVKEARAGLGKAVELIDKAISGMGSTEKAEAFEGEETTEEEELEDEAEEDEGAEKKAPAKSHQAKNITKANQPVGKAVARSLEQVTKALTQLSEQVAEMKKAPRSGGPARMVDKRLGFSGAQMPADSERMMTVVSKALESLPPDATKADVDRAIAMAVMRDVQT